MGENRLVRRHEVVVETGRVDHVHDVVVVERTRTAKCLGACDRIVLEVYIIPPNRKRDHLGAVGQRIDLRRLGVEPIGTDDGIGRRPRTRYKSSRAEVQRALQKPRVGCSASVARV